MLYNSSFTPNTNRMVIIKIHQIKLCVIDRFNFPKSIYSGISLKRTWYRADNFLRRTAVLGTDWDRQIFESMVHFKQISPYNSKLKSIKQHQLTTAPFLFFSDMNECEMDIHSCSHQCVNTPGSYTCQCPQGFQLSSDRLNCRQQQPVNDQGTY